MGTDCTRLIVMSRVCYQLGPSACSQ